MKCCGNCGEVTRRGKWDSPSRKYFCVTGDVVERDHVCDGWKTNRPIADTSFFKLVDAALERLERDDWKIAENKRRKNYRKAEEES